MRPHDTTGPPPEPDDGDFPARRAPLCGDVAELDAVVTGCRACPRLVAWREEVAVVKRAAFRDWEYWGRPVPGFGPTDAALGVVGLAPAAHGANRTGRMFTGDPSGDFLVKALYQVGLASSPTCTDVDDGLELYGLRLTAPVRCAPPQNKPTPAERDTCRPWLAREIELLSPSLRVIVVLGAFGWQALLPVLRDAGYQLPPRRPAFGHGVHVVLPGPGDARDLQLLGCYHPSMRNTSTGRLTQPMLVEVFDRAADLAGLERRDG
ncbi:uracil-DNA glycosylase [Streptomyces sp. NPDC058685]|uniref:uracil-DNA glycosylase n=1 Tax=Streptomyces sp. NPDC058685 TaxID=3346598 RepID=UPI00364DB403